MSCWWYQRNPRQCRESSRSSWISALAQVPQQLEVLPGQHPQLVELGESTGEVAAHLTPPALLLPPNRQRRLVRGPELVVRGAAALVRVVEEVDELVRVGLTPHDPGPQLVLDGGAARLRDPIGEEPDAYRAIVVRPLRHDAIFTWACDGLGR